MTGMHPELLAALADLLGAPLDQVEAPPPDDTAPQAVDDDPA